MNMYFRSQISDHMSRIAVVLAIIASSALTSCYNCVTCTDCVSEEYNVEDSCYATAKDYYNNRSEWKDDVKTYEEFYECKCQ